MEKGKTWLKLFHGCLKPFDEVLLQVSHGGSSHFPEFQVSSETNKTLLSAETFQKLKLLKLPSQAEVLVLYDKTALLTV